MRQKWLFLEIKCEKNDVCLSWNLLFGIMKRRGNYGTEVVGNNEKRE